MPEVELLKLSIPVDSNSYKQLKQHGFNIGDTIYRVPASSYANYFVSNNVVLVQKYWKPGMPQNQMKKDEDSKQIIARLFPGREVIAIYSHSINRGGGCIHCMTHEIPVAK